MKIFKQHKYWLLDFPNSKIYFILDVNKTLQKLHKSLEDFVKISLLNDKEHLAIALQTDYGEKNFMIDTGAQGTIMRPFSKDLSPHQFIHLKKFSSQEFYFSPQKIYLYNFSDKFSYDGILGIDFLQKRSIFLDFENNHIFISKESKD